MTVFILGSNPRYAETPDRLSGVSSAVRGLPAAGRRRCRPRVLRLLAVELPVQRLDPITRVLVVARTHATPSAAITPSPAAPERRPQEPEDEEDEEEREQDPESSEEEGVVVDRRRDRRARRDESLRHPQLVPEDTRDPRDHEHHDDSEASHVNLLCDVVERKSHTR